MSVKIYEMAHSPYCIPITQALTALDVSHERIPVSNWDRSEVIRLTNGAYYQVPVLVNGDDVIFESSDSSLDVAAYVDTKFGDGKLFPPTHAGIHEILVEYIEDDVEALTFKLCDIDYVPAIEDEVARTMVRRHKERRFGRGCLETWRRDEAKLKKEAESGFGRFDSRLQHSQFLLSDDAPMYVDFALYGVIGNYLHGGHHTLAQEHEALRAWHATLTEFRF